MQCIFGRSILVVQLCGYVTFCFNSECVSVCVYLERPAVVPPPRFSAAVVTSGVVNWIWQVYVRDYVLQYLPVLLRGFVRDPPSRGHLFLCAP